MTSRLSIVFIVIFVIAAAAHGQTVTERSSHFRIVHPATLGSRDARNVLDLLENNRATLVQRVSNAGIDVSFGNLEIVFNATTGDFVARTGMPAWAAAATTKNQIELQPFRLLQRRGILETTLRHELAHALIDALGNGKTPRWLAEGFAIYLAGEGRLLERYRSEKINSAQAVEKSLADSKSPAEMRTAYANAYTLVLELIRSAGEGGIWKRMVRTAT